MKEREPSSEYSGGEHRDDVSSIDALRRDDSALFQDYYEAEMAVDGAKKRGDRKGFDAAKEYLDDVKQNVSRAGHDIPNRIQLERWLTDQDDDHPDVVEMRRKLHKFSGDETE